MPKKIYTTEMKLEIVKRYIKGNIGLKELAKQYHIGSKADIQKWLAAYREHGVKGLNTRTWTYTGDFKVCVVEYMYKTGTSIRSTAAHFNIPSPQTVSKWELVYSKQGKQALYEENRGGPGKMRIRKKCTKKKNTECKEELLAEVQRLRMENEYLKNLNALVQERERSAEPTEWLSSQN